MQAVFPEDEATLKAIVATISLPRLSKYLVEAKGDVGYALRLYHWNAQLSQSLYLRLQSWEIALRNKLNDFLIYKYGPDWPTKQKAFRNLSRKDQVRLDDALRRQAHKRKTVQPTTNHIVADLSAGFWVSQLGKSYAIAYSWHNNLKWRIFVNDASLTREDAAATCSDLLDLRNRVAHHEPIFLLDLPALKGKLDHLVEAMCAGTADYMASACSFDEIWSDRPEPPSDTDG